MENPLEKLRREQRNARAHGDLIPIPVLILVFVAVWFLVLFLLAPGWKVQFDTYRSRAAQLRNNHQAAIAPLERLVQRFPTSVTFLSELGHCYYQVGQYENALQYFLKAQEVADKQGTTESEDGPVPPPSFHTSIGMTYVKLGNIAEAEKYLQLALNRNRLDKYANLTMGEIEVNRKNYQKAMNYFKVLASDPSFRESVQKHYKRIEEEMFAGVS